MTDAGAHERAQTRGHDLARERVGDARRGRGLVSVVVGLVLLGVVAVVAYALLGTQSLPDGPLPVAWDQQPCAHCQMHLGDPGFAVQLQLTDGDTVYFDDPTCYFAYLDEHSLDVHATYFHHRHDDRWLPRTAVAFVREGASPMGGSLAAVDAGTEGALDYEAARVRAREDERARPGQRPAVAVPAGTGG